MKLTRVQYMHGGSKAIFYFSAEGRVDFRDLVKDLAQRLRTRIEMRQIGIRDEAKMIGYLVAAAANHTPWQSLCLVQVLVTQRLLAKRNIPGQFYLGVRPGCERSDDPTGLAAHAWLQCGDAIVNGAAGHEQYTVVSTFSWGDSAALANGTDSTN